LFVFVKEKFGGGREGEQEKWLTGNTTYNQLPVNLMNEIHQLKGRTTINFSAPLSSAEKFN